MRGQRPTPPHYRRLEAASGPDRSPKGMRGRRHTGHPPARTLPSSYEWVLCTRWASAHRASRQPQSLSVGTRWCDCGVLVRVQKGIQQSSPRSFVSHSLAQMLRPLVLISGGLWVLPGSQSWGTAAPCYLGGESRQEAPVFWQFHPGRQSPQLPKGHGAQHAWTWASPDVDSHNF